MKDRSKNRLSGPGTFRSGLKKPRVLCALFFLAVVVAVCALGRLPWTVSFVYATMSSIAFGTYAFDKFSAKTRRWRTPEKSLLTLGLFGGWPGAMLAQEWVRHKTAKFTFQASFWATVVLNVTGFLWLVFQGPEQVEAMVRSLWSAVIPNRTGR